MSNDALALMLQLKDQYDHAYYNTGEPIVSDAEYDNLIEKIKEIDPKHPSLTKTGIQPKKTPVTLPYPMPSLRKVFAGRDDVVSEVDKLLARSNVIFIMPKLDGNSGAVYCNEDGRFLYQRGDGIVGSNVTHYLPHLHTKFDVLPKGIMIRGECIMPKRTFREKYSKDYINARNLVSGIMNADFDVKIGDVDFIAYDIIHLSDEVCDKLNELLDPISDPSDSGKLYFSDIFSILMLNDVICVPVLSLYKEGDGYCLVDNPGDHGEGKLLVDKIHLEKHLCNIYDHFVETLPYEIDGLVVRSDELVINQPLDTALPKHAFAFKVNKTTQTTVVGITWKISMNKRLIPLVELAPIFISGATVTYATGHNAKNVIENGINTGAVVNITRSGEVIPYIESVVKASSIPPLPPYDPNDYEWDGPHLVLKENNDDVLIAMLVYVVEVLEFDGWGSAVLTDLVKAGIITTLTDLYSCDLNQIHQKIPEGYGEVKVNNLIHSRTKALSQVKLPALMAASRQFGSTFGRRRFEMILKHHRPDDPIGFKDYAKDEIMKMVLKFDNIGEAFANVFASQYQSWVNFYLSIKDYVTLLPSEIWLRQKPKNNEVVFTLVRDKVLEQQLISLGFVIGDKVSTNTIAVVTRDPDAQSKKLDKARASGIPIYTLEAAKEMKWTLEN